MKRNDIKQLHQLDLPELKAKLEQLHAELFTAQMENVARKLKNVASLSHLKKDIARVKTVMKAKELAQGTV